MHATQEKTTSKHVSKIPNTYSHSSSAYKSKTKLKNRNPQILDVEYTQNLWISKLHRNCNKDHFMVLQSVLKHQSRILSNLGWVLTRYSTHTQISNFHYFWKNWFFKYIFQSIQVWFISKNSYLKVLPKDSLDKIDAFCTINEVLTTFCSKVIRIWIVLIFPQIGVFP